MPETHATLMIHKRLSTPFRSIRGNHGRIAAATLGGIATIILTIYHLRSLAPTLSPSERTFVTASSSLHAILFNPTHLFLKLLIFAVHYVPINSTLAARVPSVGLALLTLGLFTYILNRWYGPRSTLFGFFIFLTSAWFLHAARFAGPDIEYLLAIVALIAVHVGLYDRGHNQLMLYTWLFVNLALLTVPGMVWFVVLGIIWQAGALISGLRSAAPLWSKLAWSFLALAGLAAAGWSLYRIPNLWRTWLGLPQQFTSWRIPIFHFGDTILALFYRAPHNPENWLGRLPILDVFTSVMLIAGIIFYIRHWRATRTHLLTVYFFAGASLIALNGEVSLSVLVPIVYLIAVAGIAYTLHAWLHIFPRNPIARTMGIGIVTLVLLLSCAYNLSQYFIAWPHNAETAAIYMPPPKGNA